MKSEKDGEMRSDKENGEPKSEVRTNDESVVDADEKAARKLDAVFSNIETHRAQNAAAVARDAAKKGGKGAFLTPQANVEKPSKGAARAAGPPAGASPAKPATSATSATPGSASATLSQTDERKFAVECEALRKQIVTHEVGWALGWYPIADSVAALKERYEGRLQNIAVAIAAALDRSERFVYILLDIAKHPPGLRARAGDVGLAANQGRLRQLTKLNLEDREGALVAFEKGGGAAFDEALAKLNGAKRAPRALIEEEKENPEFAKIMNSSRAKIEELRSMAANDPQLAALLSSKLLRRSREESPDSEPAPRSLSKGGEDGHKWELPEFPSMKVLRTAIRTIGLTEAAEMEEKTERLRKGLGVRSVDLRVLLKEKRTTTLGDRKHTVVVSRVSVPRAALEAALAATRDTGERIRDGKVESVDLTAKAVHDEPELTDAVVEILIR